MPIRRERRFFYPTDWPQPSAVIRFGWVEGRCEGLKHPHEQSAHRLRDTSVGR